jgi:hypothetical protein
MERESGSDDERDSGDTSEDSDEGSESSQEDCADKRHKQFRCEVSEKLKQEVIPLQAIFDIQEEVEHMCFRFDRHADFLSDFGSSEPFLIDGDALIMHALNSKCLDWRNGGQILHHMYIVESFLQKLCVRGCQFDIFFLQDNEPLFKRESASYILARTVVIHRLNSYAASRQASGTGSFKVHVITGSWLDSMDCMDEGNERNPSLVVLVKTCRPSFIMSYAGYNDDHPMMFAAAQMTFVHSCLLEHNIIIITLETLAFEGSRIYGFLFYPPSSPSSSDTLLHCYRLIRPELKQLARREGEDSQSARSSIQLALDSTQGDEFRTTIYLQTLIHLLDAGRTPHDRTIGLVMVSIACVGAMQRLLLKDRAFVLPGDDQRQRSSALAFIPSSVSHLSETVATFQKTVIHFQNKLCCALADSIQQATGMSVESTATDVFDGRLFSFILLQLVAGWTLPDWLGDTCVQHFTTVSTIFHTESGRALDFKIKSTEVTLFTHDRPEDPLCDCWWAAVKRLLLISDDERVWAKSVLDEAKKVRGTKSQLQHARLRPVGAGNMLSQVLGDVRERMMQFENTDEDDVASGVGAFVPHHYHNTRPLEEPDSFSYKFEQRQYARKGVESLEMRLEKIEDRFSRGMISKKWSDEMIEVERMLSDGRLKEGRYKILKQKMNKCIRGEMTDKEYQTIRSKLIQRANADAAAWALQQEQKKARAERAFQKSLLEGSPVREMVIAERERLTEEKLKDRKSNAQKRLGTTAASAVSEKPEHQEQTTSKKYLDIVKSKKSDAEKIFALSSLLRKEENKKLVDCFRGKGQWRGRDDDARFDGAPHWTYVISKLDGCDCNQACNDGGGGSSSSRGGGGKTAQLIKQNVEKKEKEKVDTDKEQFENLKKNTTAEREHPGKYLAKFEEFASKENRSAIFALMARMHALEYVADGKCGTEIEKQQKQIFVMAQRILRAHGSIMEGTHNEQLTSIMGRAGFHDMAEMLYSSLKGIGGKSKPKTSKFGGPSCCSIRFQLEHAPEHLGRPEGFKGDDRVQFAPDAWQQRLLDIVDSNNSALVVAPTASGKTFISYYVMELCLKVNDGDVVVYVAPTKALVNQVRAEISARFSKSYVKGGKLVSVFTRDFRDENFLDAQILVTVPQCLGILFLTGSRSNAMWTERIRHIIFDEVHCIGDKGGEIWEQLLLLMEPKNGFLALSATLGNVDHFYNWLQRVEEQRGRKVYKVLHNERWNDLFPWIWGNKFRDNCINVKTSEGSSKFLEYAWAQFGTRSPISHVTAVFCDPERADQELINAEKLNQKVAVAKRGGGPFVEKAQRAQQAGALALIIINTDNTLMTPGADDSAVTIPVILVTADAGATLLQEGSNVSWAHDKCAVVPLNPCWILNKLTAMKPLINAETFPNDLKLLPDHCIMLYDALLPHIDESSRQTLDPKTFFQGHQDALWNLSMRDASAWENQLKLSLFNMNAEHQKAVLESLSTESEACFVKSDKMIGQLGEWEYVNWQIVPLTEDLKRRDMLPAVCFMLSRSGCLELARSVTKGFEAKERAKRSDEQWMSKREKLETTLEELKKQYEKCKGAPVLDENGEVISDDKGDIKSEIDAIRQKLIEMLKPDAEFCVAQISDSDIENAFGSMPFGKIWQDFCVPHKILIPALYRGIGVHHAGLNKKYRQAIERLFRFKKLGVVFATTTLAMGINMPAKTSVLIGDAVYLNAMSFRQMSGRAGRRGFDLRGNTVFMGIPSEKCFRLLKSDLPKLQGNLVMSNSLALRLFIRQSELSKLGPGAHESGIRSCKNLINFPLFNPFADAHKDSDLMGKQMAHCFRFSVEFLFRMGLLRQVDGPVGLEPNDLSAFVAHLFFMEPSNFAFLTLLLEGKALKLLCRPDRPKEDREVLVLSILCNIFCRQYLPKSVAHWAINNRSKTGPSCVVLEGLSKIGDLVGTGDGGKIREGQLVKNILQEHNARAIKTLTEYTACFVTAYGHELGLDKLPFSDGRLGEDIQVDEVRLGEEWRSLVMPRISVRSPFVALSGHCDEFSSIQELCETARGSLFLDPKMVPIFELHNEETTFVNSFLLDFYKHGQRSALVRYNFIQEDDLFDELQNFSLVLKALSAAMERRAGLYPDSRIPFDDKNVRETFAAISGCFSEKLREIAA